MVHIQDRCQAQGKHPGESGYDYVEPDSVSGTIPTGTFYDANGNSIEISKSGSKYSCKVTRVNSAKSADTWQFAGTEVNGKISYTDGRIDHIFYKDNGYLDRFEYFLDQIGSLTSSNTGLVWADNAGNQMVFAG